MWHDLKFSHISLKLDFGKLSFFNHVFLKLLRLFLTVSNCLQPFCLFDFKKLEVNYLTTLEVFLSRYILKAFTSAEDKLIVHRRQG